MMQKKGLNKTLIKEFIHKLHSASQERITSPVVSKTNQSASIRDDLKKSALPIQVHIIQKRKEYNREKTEKEGCRGRCQSTWKYTEKHRHKVGKKGREDERSIQMCSYTINKMQHTFNTSNRLPTMNLTVHEQRWRNDECCIQREKRQRRWGMQISFLKKQKNK